MRDGLQIMNYVFVIILISVQLRLFIYVLPGNARVRGTVTLYTGVLKLEFYATCAGFSLTAIVLAFTFFPGHACSAFQTILMVFSGRTLVQSDFFFSAFP